MKKLVLLLILIIMVSMFVVVNASDVSINLIFVKYDISLAIVIFISLLLGALIALIISFFDKFQNYKDKSKLKKQLEECEEELKKLKRQQNPIKFELKKEKKEDEIIQ